MVHLPPDYEILTARCRLRRPSEADIPHVFSATRVAGFNDGMAWEAPESIEELREPLRKNLAAWTEGTAFAFTIESKTNRTFLGRISIRSRPEDGLWDIGFWTHPEHQGRGDMSEAAQAVLEFGFGYLLAKRIQAGFVAWNVKSERILKKLGMKFVRHVPDGFQKKGQWVEVAVMAIEASDWRSPSAASSTTGNQMADDLRAMERNLLCHFSYLARRIGGMEVIDTPEYLLVNSGLPSDNFNIIYCRSPWRPSCNTGLREAIDTFQSQNLPFAVWVSPESQVEFSETLLELGRKQGQTETGMLLHPDAFAPPACPAGLTITRVRDAEGIRHFARVIAADDMPPAAASVEQFFRQAHDALMSPDCPMHLFVGYSNGQPVATCEVLIAEDVAGVYSVSTLKAHRRQGIGSAMTARAVQQAFGRGCRFAGLQASDDGKGVYAKLGFKECCQFAHFH